MIAQEQTGAQSAGFPERLVAYVIDALILAVPYVLMYLLLPMALYYLLSFVLGAAYAVYFWTSSGSTPGKSAMGLKVVSATTGDIVDPGQAILRYVGYLVSSIPLGLGFLWIIWDEKHEGWHDKIAKTLVVKK